jgi:hypothetical protein
MNFCTEYRYVILAFHANFDAKHYENNFINVYWNSRLNPCRALDYHFVKKGYLSSCKFSKVWRGADRYLSL